MANRNVRPSGADQLVWVRANNAAPLSTPWVGVALETASMQLDDFLYASKAQYVPEQANNDSPVPEVVVQAAPAPGLCPRCQAKVSAVEQKMERCLNCGAGLRQSANGTMEPAAPRRMTVGI